MRSEIFRRIPNCSISSPQSNHFAESSENSTAESKLESDTDPSSWFPDFFDFDFDFGFILCPDFESAFGYGMSSP